MPRGKAKAPDAAKRETDIWIASLQKDDAAPRLVALIERAVASPGSAGGKRADRLTTERALGLGALALARFAASRGRSDAEALITTILDRWPRWARAASQRDAFLRNALAVAAARGPLAKRLVATVPEDAPAAVLISLACLHAAAGDAKATARAIDRALDAGASPAQLRAERELTAAVKTAPIARLLAQREPPVARPASTTALAGAAKAALKELDALARLLAKDGDAVVEGAPATSARVAEAAARSPVGFPAEYQALLAARDGGTYGTDLTILGTADWIGATRLYKRARAYIEDSARYGSPELLECAPIANLGQPNDWILYAPRGIPDDRAARFLYCLNADWLAMPSLAKAFGRKVRIAGG